MVAVVPSSDFRQAVLASQIMRHLGDFLRREADDVVIARAQDRADIEVVEVAENAFLSHTQDASQHSKCQIVIALERTAEQLLQEGNAFPIKTILPSLLDRCIIFINEQDDLPPIMLTQHLHQESQRRRKARFIRFHLYNLLEALLQRILHARAVEQIGVPEK